MSKKMALPGCDNCADTACPLKNCSRCKLVKYCSKPCQSQHWKAGHKKRCVAVADRKPFAATEDASVPKCVICLEALQEGVVDLTHDIDFFEKHAIVKIKCGHQFHLKCAYEAARESATCVICRADILAGESFTRITYKGLLILDRCSISDELAIYVAKDKIGELATVVEKEVLEIPDRKLTEECASNIFLYNVFKLQGASLG